MSGSYHIDDEATQKAYDSRLMRRLLGYVKPYRFWMATAIALLLIASMLSNLAPLLNMWAIDHYIDDQARVALQQHGENVTTTTPLEEARDRDSRGLLRLLVLLCAVTIGQTLARYGHGLIVAYVGQKTMMEMRVELFDHLQRMSLRFLDRNPVGRLMTRVTNDVETIQQSIVSGMVQVISDLSTMAVILGFMLWVNWALALITLSTVPFVFVTGLLFRKYARRSYLAIRKKIAHLNAFTQENITGMRVVQAFWQQDRAMREHSARNADHRDEWLRQVRNYALYFPAVDFLGALSMSLIILYIGLRMLGGASIAAGGASVGALFAYIQWGERLFGPIRALADRYNILLEAMASSERVFGLLDTPEDVQDKPGAVVCQDIAGDVDFEHVWFTYDGEDREPSEPPRWVLKDVNLRIRRGERVAVVGHTGAGKTTLVNLLGRFYDVQQGNVRVDGIDVRDYEQVSLRRHIGTVLQDVFLFAGSIGENIRLGNPALSDKDVRDCAAYVNAARFIERLPGGYDYDVGERGCNLSTGQRQLLAFARALAHNPQVLVLDEATSSVDTETEGLIQDAIAKLMAGRTCIVIAHRLSTVQHADRIVVMHHGEIREEGDHQSLLARGGLYYRLYQLQYKDQLMRGA